MYLGVPLPSVPNWTRGLSRTIEQSLLVIIGTDVPYVRAPSALDSKCCGMST